MLTQVLKYRYRPLPVWPYRYRCTGTQCTNGTRVHVHVQMYCRRRVAYRYRYAVPVAPNACMHGMAIYIATACYLPVGIAILQYCNSKNATTRYCNTNLVALLQHTWYVDMPYIAILQYLAPGNTVLQYRYP